MGLALSLKTRMQIIEMLAAGKPPIKIGEELDCSVVTVYNIKKRHSEQGPQGLKPSYSNCGNRPPREGDKPYRSVRYLKRLHPGWGAEKILSEIKYKYPTLTLPTKRTVNRWFVSWGYNRRERLKRAPHGGWNKEVHGCWQVDAKEKVKLSTGQKVCWLTIVDERSGASLAAPVFPPREDKPGGVNDDKRKG